MCILWQWVDLAYIRTHTNISIYIHTYILRKAAYTRLRFQLYASVCLHFCCCFLFKEELWKRNRRIQYCRIQDVGCEISKFHFRFSHFLYFWMFVIYFDFDLFVFLFLYSIFAYLICLQCIDTYIQYCARYMQFGIEITLILVFLTR